MTALFVLLMIGIMLAIEWLVRRSEKTSMPLSTYSRENSYTIRLPEGVFFAPNHTWVNLFPSGSVHVGVGDFIGRLFEHPKILFLRQVGDHVSAGDPIFHLKQDDHHLTIRSPLAGTVTSQNERILTQPEILHESPFNKGWALAIHPEEPTKIRNFFFGNESGSWIKSEIARFKDLLGSVSMPLASEPGLYQDGGAPIAGLMISAPDTLWKRIDKEFLT